MVDGACTMKAAPAIPLHVLTPSACGDTWGMWRGVFCADGMKMKVTLMAKPKSLWPAKVLVLVKSGNHAAAVAQIKVAPTAGDIAGLQRLVAQLPSTPALVQLQRVMQEEHALMAAPRLHRSP